MLDIAQVDAPRAARLLFQLPRDCRVFTAISPANQWGWGEILTNKMTYLLEVLVWMKTKDAQRKAPQHKPKPFVPEFMGGEIGKDAEAHTTDDIKNILAMPRA